MSSVVDKQEIIDMIRLKSPRLELVSFDAGKSEAWRWFKRVRVDGHVLPYAVCNGCFKPVHYTPRDGTGGLRRHACALTVAMSQAKEKEAAKNGAHKAGSTSGESGHLSHSRSSSDRGPSASGGDRKKGGPLCPPASPSYTRRASLAAGERPEADTSGPLSHSNGGQHNGNGHSSPANHGRSRNRRSTSSASASTTVPISLTLWAAEKGLVDLNPSGTSHPPGLPAGLSIASAFAALQGIQSLVPPGALNHRSPFNHALQSLANPFLVNAQQQQSVVRTSTPSPSSNGHHPALDLALDLAMKKSSASSNNNNNNNKGGDLPLQDHPDRYPLQQVQSENEHKYQRDMDQKDRDRAQSIVDHILKNINQSSKLAIDSAKPLNLDEETSSSAVRKLNHDSNQNVDQNVEQQPSNNNRFSIVPQCRSGRRPRKRSNPDRAIPTGSILTQPHDEDIEANLQMLAQVANEPAIKRERLSPEPVNESDYNQDLISRPQRSLALYKMNGGQLTPNSQLSLPSPDVHDEMCSSKSERSSPAQFVPVASSLAIENVLSLRDSSQLKEAENFVQSLSQVLQNSPQCSLAEAAQLLQLGDLHTCLNSLIEMHKKYLQIFQSRMPVPEIQKPAPAFKGLAVVDGQFKEISLEDYKGKYVILFFYPLDFTFVCPTEIIAFSDRADEFRKINCELIACSTDSHFCHLAWVNTPRKQGGLGSLNIPLLADKSAAISKAYGVYKEDEGLTFRGLFIIDEQQRLRQITVNDLPVGRSVDETLRLVQAFQFTDKHGEVCPAGWTPGKKTMKADPAGSKEYFESAH